jgi:hypothetical protein
MGERRNSYRVSAGKPKGNRPLGRSRCRWENPREKKYGLDLSDSGERHVVSSCVINLNFP